MRSFNYALLFALIQQNNVTIFSYSIRNYNAMTSEIQTKGDPWRKILGEILKGFFITVEIYRYPGWNIFWDLINGGCRIRMSWVELFLKIRKRRETSIRDLRVVININISQLPYQCHFARTCQFYRDLFLLRSKTEYLIRWESKNLLILFVKGGGGKDVFLNCQFRCTQISDGTSLGNIFKLWYLWKCGIRGGLQN